MKIAVSDLSILVTNNNKMEDRIQINSVWYVRENTDTDGRNLELENYMHKNVVSYQCMAYEDFEWVFQAHADSVNDSELDLIEIENKVTGKKEIWDSLAFIRNFNASTYKFESNDLLNKEGAKLLYYFINEIKRKGWL
jgi:hypothetical protein